ncbi:MAG: YhcN/YlaJ family sporulation lipoprotein [Bacillota bacterium]
MKRTKLISGVVMLLLAANLCLAAGCSVQRKPMPSPTTPSTPTTPAPARKPLPTDPKEQSRLASRLASEASRVSGVNKATVFLTGSTAYVGLNLKAGVEHGQTDRIKRQVADRLKKMEPRLTRVMVTTDTDTFTRIKRVQDGIAKGRPVSAFSKEISEINRRMTPTTR